MGEYSALLDVAPPPGDTTGEADDNDDKDNGTAIVDGDANEVIPDDMPAAEEEETRQDTATRPWHTTRIGSGKTREKRNCHQQIPVSPHRHI